MGCQVQLSTEQPYFRTDKVKVVSLLHVLRSIGFIILSFTIDDGFMTLVGVAFAELFVAWWFWKLKFESWGLSFGVCLVHFLFPMTIEISLIGGSVILGTSAIQMLVLALIQNEGGYNFTHLAYLDQIETRPATPEQKRMFQLAVLAQFIKAIAVVLGGFGSLLFIDLFYPVPWLTLVPLVPLTVLLGLINLIAGLGLYTGRNWGFHLTLALVPVSFIETLLTLNGLIFLIGIWIFTIMVPCLAKDGFYSKLFPRIREKSVSYTQEVINSQESTLPSDIE
jgi:hypothetical protein